MSELKDFKEKLEVKIKECNQIFIAPHLKIDIDAFASAIGFSLIASRFSKDNYIFMCDDRSQIDAATRAMLEEYQNQSSFINIEQYKKIKSNNDLLITTDTNKKNLIACRDYLENFKNIVILDHHKTDENTIKHDLMYNSKKASSSCEIMYNLLRKFNIKIDEDLANYLLAGIYLDTHNLKNGIIKEEDTFKTVYRLIKKGASPKKVSEFLAEDLISAQKTKSLIQNAFLEKFNENTIAFTFGDENIIYQREDLAKAANELLQYKSVDAAFATGNIDKNIVAISARSKGKIDVSKIMSILNGGGNNHSAATQIENKELDTVKDELIRILKPF